MGLRQRVRWFDNRPLSGKRIMVTRARTQASALVDLLAREGAEAIEVPSIQIAPVVDDPDKSRLRRAALELSSYQWVVFTSVNGVEAFWQAMEREGLDARAFASARVAAIGPATAGSLERRGIYADSVPEEYVSEAVAEALRGHIQPGDRVLLPRVEGGRVMLVEGLLALGASVDQVVAYRTVVPEDSQEKALALLADGKIDVVTFASSSTVRNLVTLLPGDVSLLQRPVIACIGPVTADTARGLGLRVDVQAREYTIPGLVEALKAYFSADQGDAQ